MSATYLSQHFCGLAAATQRLTRELTARNKDRYGSTAPVREKGFALTQVQTPPERTFDSLRQVHLT